MKQYDLSILIPARNEMFLAKTVEDILANRQGNTEILILLDGEWAMPQIPDHPDVTIIYRSKSIGQRAACNELARLSTAKFIMKLDAHCALDRGFDVKLMADCEPNWVVVPKMYNLHVFDWKCNKCGNQTYQGRTPTKCEKCDNTKDFERVMIWKPRWNRESTHYRFDSNLHFQYWGSFKERPEAQGDIVDTMSLLGACFFMHRKYYWEIDGSDEEHGSWGQQGTEIACKTWLSGGRLVTNKKTWFAHMFRTQGGDFGFPYPMSGKDVETARKRSKDLWKNGKWAKAKYDLDWLIRKFAPVPDWDVSVSDKEIIYYTCNTHKPEIDDACRTQLLRSGLPIVSVSLNKDLDFGNTRLRVDGKRSATMMHKQVLMGLEASTAKYVFLCESDVIYHPSHFDFTPTNDEAFFYNVNVWKYHTDDGKFYWANDMQQVSGICVNREKALEFYRRRNKEIEEKGFDRHYEAGAKTGEVAVSYMSEFPNVCIRHENTLTKTKKSEHDFIDKRYAKGWKEANEIPYWGEFKSFNDFIN